MYVYSGTYRKGLVGQPTPLKDFYEKELFVGDIVIVTTIDESGICEIHNLTVVVSDEWVSYSDGTHIKNEGFSYYVMGIKDVNFMDDNSKWSVKKLKSYEDVINGEYWKDFGFNYKED